MPRPDILALPLPEGSEPQASLIDLAADAYRSQWPDAELTVFTDNDVEFLFDANPGVDRTVLAVGSPRTPVEPRDVSYQRGYPLTDRSVRRLDRGHFVPYTGGGGFGPNLFAQDTALNRGWSKEGREYRAFERRAVSAADALMFAFPTYIDTSSFPAFIQLGLMPRTRRETRTFRNRYDEEALCGQDRLTVELWGATDHQVGGLGEETVSVFLRKELGAQIITMSDAGMERTDGRQDLDIVAWLGDTLIAYEVKTTFTSRRAGTLNHAGNLHRPRLRRTKIGSRQASQPYAADRLGDIIDITADYAGIDVQVVVVDFELMALQFFNVDDAGRRLSAASPVMPCREAAEVALRRILDHRGYL
ncbi:hypothetical protein [Leifsonia soli]|uniref:Uncharacterized protein n=1 Tax=Leifsonia soli TaxID=582665 RepID=A0A852T5B7_9MICO|nr:hypothetical protein [Leifsonia soli]NYD76061.1 hypothetical protein [Leifsonia soli]